MVFDWKTEALQVPNVAAIILQVMSCIGELSTGEIVSGHAYDFLHGMNAETKTFRIDTCVNLYQMYMSEQCVRSCLLVGYGYKYIYIFRGHPGYARCPLCTSEGTNEP